MKNAKLIQVLAQLVIIKPGEVKALFVSCLYFYLLLCAYYIIRPIRDEMVIANGVANVQWLLLMTMAVLLAITPVFGWITTRFRTRQFLDYCTLFFAANLVVFFFFFDVAERSLYVTRAFFIWVNIFNMFIVSLFWSFMNDVFREDQAKRLFAFIAAGGTAGALTGPIITTTLVESVGLAFLLLISAAVLASTVLAIRWLSTWQNVKFVGKNMRGVSQAVKNQALKGGVWGGFTLVYKSPYLLGICLFVVLYAVSITFVQIQQAELIAAAYPDSAGRTKLFAQIDFAANAVTLLLQIFLTGRLIGWIGYRATLIIIPLGITAGFGLMASTPMLGVMIAIEIFRRSGDYAIMKPAREMLFSVVSREEKYKAKNFIDTAILRTGNTGSAWIYAGIKSAGAGAAGLAGISLLLGTTWCAVAYWLGGQFTRKTKLRREGPVSGQ
ncbi:MAG: MFS transporter [Gammaproteobacteria bacterium]|nr:MFS transporter [Gammaproteobacteria bacterium]